MLDIQENVPLAPLTTFRIGGSARYFVEVNNEKDLIDALEYAKQNNLEFFVLGGGANVLVNDKGFDGLAVKIKLNEIIIENQTVLAGAGAPLIKIVNAAAEEGLSGLESLAGIPGTVGGAVRGNAGAFGGTTGDTIESVKVFDSANGQTKEYSKAECGFAYRKSLFKSGKDLIILSARFTLEKGEPEIVKAKVKETIQKRVAKQLQSAKSAGSFFINPVVTNVELIKRFEEDKKIKCKDDKLPAGWFIEQLGLKGKKMGGAMISEKHANYIVNTGEAKAEDIIMLSSYIKQQVRDEFGVQLQEEITYLGF